MEKLLKVLSTVSCLILLFYMLFDLCQKFHQGISSTGSREIEPSENPYPFPDITFCPWPVFKEPMIATTEELFISNTFNETEVFVPKHIITDELNISALRGPYLGRCFSARPQKPMERDVSFTIGVLKNLDYSVYIHQPEDSTWVSLMMPFKKLTTFKFELSLHPDGSSANLLIREVSRTRLNKKTEPCGAFVDGIEFTDCVTKFIQNTIKANATCYVPAIKDYYPDNHGLPYCKTPEEAIKTVDILSRMLFKEFKGALKKACKPPCRETIFTHKLQFFHGNTWVTTSVTKEDKNTTMFLVVRFESTLVLEEVENYIYDVPNFLAALGGNLGLLIGWSVLSSLFGFIDFCSKIKDKLINRFELFFCKRH